MLPAANGAEKKPIFAGRGAKNTAAALMPSDQDLVISSSAYSTPWNGFPGNINSNQMGGNNIQYAAQFGNGVSGSIGLDDPTVWNRTAVCNLSIPAAIGLSTGAGDGMKFDVSYAKGRTKVSFSFHAAVSVRLPSTQGNSLSQVDWISSVTRQRGAPRYCRSRCRYSSF